MIKSSILWLKNKIPTTGKYKNNVWNCWSKLHLLFHLLNSKMFRRAFTEIPGTAKKCKFSGFFDGMNMMIFHIDKVDRKLVSSAKFYIPIIPLPPADSFCEHFSSNPNITTVSAWVLIPPRKPQSSNFFCPPRHWKTY